MANGLNKVIRIEFYCLLFSIPLYILLFVQFLFLILNRIHSLIHSFSFILFYYFSNESILNVRSLLLFFVVVVVGLCEEVNMNAKYGQHQFLFSLDQVRIDFRCYRCCCCCCWMHDMMIIKMLDNLTWHQQHVMSSNVNNLPFSYYRSYEHYGFSIFFLLLQIFSILFPYGKKTCKSTKLIILSYFYFLFIIYSLWKYT